MSDITGTGIKYTTITLSNINLISHSILNQHGTDLNEELYAYSTGDYWIYDNEGSAKICTTVDDKGSERSVGYKGLQETYYIRPIITISINTDNDPKLAVGDKIIINDIEFVIIQKIVNTSTLYTFTLLLNGDIGSSSYVSTEEGHETDYKDENAYKYTNSIIKDKVDEWYNDNLLSLEKG